MCAVGPCTKKINKKTLMLLCTNNGNYCVIRCCLNTSQTVNHSTSQQSSEAGTLDPTGQKKHRGKGELRNWLRIFRTGGWENWTLPRWPVLRTPVFLITASLEGGWDCPNQRSNLITANPLLQRATNPSTSPLGGRKRKKKGGSEGGISDSAKLTLVYEGKKQKIKPKN